MTFLQPCLVHYISPVGIYRQSRHIPPSLSETLVSPGEQRTRRSVIYRRNCYNLLCHKFEVRFSRGTGIGFLSRWTGLFGRIRFFHYNIIRGEKKLEIDRLHVAILYDNIGGLSFVWLFSFWSRIPLTMTTRLQDRSSIILYDKSSTRCGQSCRV